MTRLQRGLAILGISLLALGTQGQTGRGAFDDSPFRGRPAPSCPGIEVPAGQRISAHAYAKGVQIYRWDGAQWAFVAPEATLFADPCFRGPIGLHFAGPVWEATDGSQVSGLRIASCAADRGAIPWLLLRGKSSSDTGRFGRCTYIQRVNTIGGTAPAEGGTLIGEEARVPYTAEYLFYREAGPGFLAPDNQEPFEE